MFYADDTALKVSNCVLVTCSFAITQYFMLYRHLKENVVLQKIECRDLYTKERQDISRAMLVLPSIS